MVDMKQIKEITDDVVATHEGHISTHYAGCHRYHAGCLAFIIKEILEEEDD